LNVPKVLLTNIRILLNTGFNPQIFSCFGRPEASLLSSGEEYFIVAQLSKNHIDRKMLKVKSKK